LEFSILPQNELNTRKNYPESPVVAQKILQSYENYLKNPDYGSYAMVAAAIQ
jgi:hypothetical protein